MQATLGTGGLTKFAGTTVHLLLTSEDELSCAGTRGNATTLDDYALTTTAACAIGVSGVVG